VNYEFGITNCGLGLDAAKTAYSTGVAMKQLLILTDSWR
jgi:hypothetical protein